MAVTDHLPSAPSGKNLYWLLFAMFVIGVLGIAMASIGIQFYQKCKDKVALDKTNWQWLIWMLAGFCAIVFFIIIYAIIVVRKTRKNFSLSKEGDGGSVEVTDYHTQASMGGRI
jgi:uncharacterized membrane protein